MFKKKSSVGIIYTGDEKIIMGKRKDTRAWTFIGGGKEMFETPKACIIREIREEIGINVLNVSFIEKAETPKAIVYIYNVFLTEHSDGLNFTVLADPDQEFSEIKCFKREEIKDLYLHFPLEDNVVTKVLRLSPQIKTDSLADSPIDSLADKAREIQKVQLDAVSVEELDMGIVEKIKAEKSLANKARLILKFKSLSILEKAKAINYYEENKTPQSGAEDIEETINAKGLIEPKVEPIVPTDPVIDPKIQEVLDIINKDDLTAEHLSYLSLIDIKELDTLSGADKLEEAVLKLITKLKNTFDLDSVVGEKLIRDLEELFFDKDEKSTINDKQDAKAMNDIKKSLSRNLDIKKKLHEALRYFEKTQEK